MKENIKNSEFLYQSSPDHINFFLYPPMNPIGSDQSICLEKVLPLNQFIEKSSLFTIYISVPYCRKRCHSCCCFRGFLPQDRQKSKFLSDYVECIISQAKKYAASNRFSSEKCGAIYIGGGTASLLLPKHIDKIITILKEIFIMAPDVEINLEGNPSDFSVEYLYEVKKSGVTRLSIGYQSSQPKILQALNTYHTSNDSINAVKNSLLIGFNTVNVDLLYNVPGQTFDEWLMDLDTILAFKTQGISAGDYVVFSGSEAEKLITSKKLKKQYSHEIAYNWYLKTCDILAKHNYIEQVRGIFSQPEHMQKYVAFSCGKECSEIIGLGAGAYNFIGRYQFRTTSDSELYKKQVCNGLFAIADSVSERATDKNLMERYIILNFYFSSLNRKDFFSRFNQDPLEVFPEIFLKLKKYNLVVIDNQSVRLTKLGKKWRRNIYYEFHSSKFKKE